MKGDSRWVTALHYAFQDEEYLVGHLGAGVGGRSCLGTRRSPLGAGALGPTQTRRQPLLTSSWTSRLLLSSGGEPAPPSFLEAWPCLPGAPGAAPAFPSSPLAAAVPGNGLLRWRGPPHTAEPLRGPPAPRARPVLPGRDGAGHPLAAPAGLCPQVRPSGPPLPSQPLLTAGAWHRQVPSTVQGTV